MPKRVIPLSDLQLSKAKPQNKQYSLFDGGGLFILVTPSGGKLWRFKYRFEGRDKLISFGGYPEVSLQEARKRRDEAKTQIANGIDPLEARKAEKAARLDDKANTFEAITREWNERFKNNRSEAHGQRIMRRLEVDVFPFLGPRPISEIKSPDVLEVLRRVEARTLETAHRLKIACSQIFRYAVSTGKIEYDPTAALKGALPPVKYKHFAAPIDPKNAAPVLRAIEGYEGSFVVKCALKLAPLTFVRPGELRKAEWPEIDFENKQWTIPAERMKMKLPHIVPLADQALSILCELKEVTGQGKYLFPGHRSPLRCMSENAVNAALRRMGFSKEEITGHGFRAMARTILDEVLHFRPDYIEHQLAHAVRDPQGRAYNRTSFLDERREMMQKWADFLDEIKVGAKVVPFRSVN